MHKNALHTIENTSFIDEATGSSKQAKKEKSKLPKRITIMEALEVLPKPCKDVCILHFYNNLSRSEIARQLRISKSTVFNRLHRGLYLLKKQLAAKAVKQ